MKKIESQDENMQVPHMRDADVATREALNLGEDVLITDQHRRDAVIKLTKLMKGDSVLYDGSGNFKTNAQLGNEGLIKLAQSSADLTSIRMALAPVGQRTINILGRIVRLP